MASPTRHVVPVLAAALLLAVAAPPAPSDPLASARDRMVASQIEARGVKDARVLQAMRTVERHRFVPAALQAEAYADRPLPIGLEQTISQPYIVALMTELAAEVYSIEIVVPLADQARSRLAGLGYANVTVRAGDGYRGWPERAPFDAILVTAAPPAIPQPLVDQLAPGGRLVVPVGPEGGAQELVVVERGAAGFTRRTTIPVRFVPMTGEAQRGR